MNWRDTVATARIGNNANILSSKDVDNNTTSSRTSISRNDEDGIDYTKNEDCDNVSKNDESFSSFLSSSIGSNISKSFDWALETTTMQSCQNPFECYCLPMKPPTARQQTGITRLRRKQPEEDESDEARRMSLGESEDDNEEEKDISLKPYVPLSLPLFCEFCGSPSIRNCREFDPYCKRPKTFFPKAKTPFNQSTAYNPL